jgi:hypothetical protein
LFINLNNDDQEIYPVSVVVSKKMQPFLKDLEIIPGNTNPKITFKKYNWNLFPGNYKTENNE